MPRAQRKGFNLDELFDGTPIEGVYTSAGLTASPQSGYSPHLESVSSKSRKKSKENPVTSIEFNKQRYDRSLRGTSEYIKGLEQQQQQQTDYAAMNNRSIICLLLLLLF